MRRLGRQRVTIFLYYTYPLIFYSRTHHDINLGSLCISSLLLSNRNVIFSGWLFVLVKHLVCNCIVRYKNSLSLEDFFLSKYAILHTFF